MSNTIKIERTSWVILILLSLIWGCSFILIKKSLVAFSPVQLASLRLAISAIAFTPIVLAHRQYIDWKLWPKFIAVGLTGSGIPAFLFFFAQTQITSSVAGLLNSLTPLWTLLVGIFIFKLNFERSKLIGVLLGFAGAAMLLLSGEETVLGGNPWYGILIVLATVCYASSVNMVQAFFSDVRPIVISSMSFFLIGPPFILYLIFSDFTEILMTNEHAWQALGAVTLLSLFGTVLSSVLFYYLVQKTNAVFGSTVTYLMPIVALGWGFWDGEVISILHFLSMGLILIGVYITKK
ncbi:MAG: DMT family transporter [Saprospiraceae bacterium]|nr:DMT family transporter [Saprospiraceae bacterium]